MKKPNEFPEIEDFSLVLGGPVYQLLLGSHLSDKAPTALGRRVLVLSLIAWAPLLILAAWEGHLTAGPVTIPFLSDPEVSLRFLMALPLLVLAELMAHQRMRPMVKCFLERNLIRDADLERFRGFITAAWKLRNSVLAELLMVVAVYGLGVFIIFRHYFVLDTPTWYGTPGPGGYELSMAGHWYGYVSLPIFQFLLVRWYFRIFIWARFLWSVARLPLQLVPTHPDRLGGLGFIAGSVQALILVAVAHGTLVAGNFANRILFTGDRLLDFRFEIVGLAVFLCLLLMGPLVFFLPQLERVKRTGLREYGTLAQRYVTEFDQKWLRGGADEDESIVGSADIQSLADLNTSFAVVKEMHIVPITRDAIVQLAAAAIAPFLPLALTMMPLEELAKQLFGVLF